MKKLIIWLLVLLPCSLFAGPLTERLKTIGLINDIKNLSAYGEYKEKCEFYLTQHLNQKDSLSGTFNQRIFICHRGFDRPTVLVTEGYMADYAVNVRYNIELADILNANIVVCEHRYFGKSMPEIINWDYLTVENEAADLHNVVKTLKILYKQKWVATGVSKGGMTTVFYNTFYPGDVDAYVPYVAPLNSCPEEKLHSQYIFTKSGTPAMRDKMRAAQLYFLKNKKTIFPEWSKLCDRNQLKFKVSKSQIYDLCVLEYSFSFWQYWNKEDIPDFKSYTAENSAQYLYKYVEPNYFSPETDISSFYVQAAKEIGYYTYDVTPFKAYIKPEEVENYMYNVIMPQDMPHFEFDSALYNKVVDYYTTNDPKMIFIYGEYDPWSASGMFRVVSDKDKQNMKFYINPEGSHSSEIKDFSSSTQDEIKTKLKKWLE